MSGVGEKKTNPVTFQKPLHSATRTKKKKKCFFTASKSYSLCRLANRACVVIASFDAKSSKTFLMFHNKSDMSTESLS